jgi:serine/threonine-protein kinase PpkA
MKERVPDIPGYRIERQLGEGGMAHVYLATQLSLDRQVAVKVVRFSGPDSEALALRFENEARTIAQLEHPGIVGVFDVGRTRDGLPYYTMAYLPNGDLSKAAIRGDGERIADMLESIARALGFAHSQGVIHRDVKPENVLFDREHRARLADFGISRSLSRNVRVTADGFAPGSAAYMSPEQSRGAPVDARSDLYSLGVVAFEMLSGHTPYQRTDPVSMAIAHHDQPIPRLPPEQSHWQPLIDKALAKRPDQRFQDAEEFIAALNALRGTLASTRIDPALVRPGPGSAVHPLLIWSLLLVSLVAVGALLWPALNARRSVDTSVAAAHASSLEAARLDPMLLELPARIEARHWFEPEAGSASSLLASALASNRSKQTLLVADDFVRAVGAVIDDALAAGRDAPAVALQAKLDEFVRAQALGDRPASVELRATLAETLDQRLASAERADRPESVAGLASLFAADPELHNRWSQLATRWAPGRALRDRGGPPMTVIPVGSGHVAMSVHEVSRAEYLKFQRAEPRAHARCRPPGSALGLVQRHDWSDPGFEQGSQHPVVCVTAEDARVYARWLSAQTGQRYRLPTEAEWRAAAAQVDVNQSACRIGNVFDQSNSRKLVLRDRFDCTDGAEHTERVGRYLATSWGIHDLVGNVSEWVSLCPASVLNCAETRAFGSSWRSGREEPLLDLRDSRREDAAALDVGFRLVRELQ